MAPRLFESSGSEPGFHLRLLPRRSPAHPDSAACQGLPLPPLPGTERGLCDSAAPTFHPTPGSLPAGETCQGCFWLKAPSWQHSPAGPELLGALTHLPKRLPGIIEGTECGTRLFVCRGTFVGRAAVIKRIWRGCREPSPDLVAMRSCAETWQPLALL